MRKSELFDAYLSETLTPEQAEELKKVLATESGSKEFMHYMTESHLMCEILKKKAEQKQDEEVGVKSKSRIIPFVTVLATAAAVVIFLLIRTPVEPPVTLTVIEKGVKKEVLLTEKKVYKTAEINQVTMPDGTEVNSRGNGQLTVENKNSVKVANGLFSFAVKPRSEDKRFRIDMTHGSIEVIGTAFDVIDSQELSSVRVTEGTVSFIHGTDVLILNAGDSAQANKDSLIKIEENIDDKLELFIDGEYTDDKRAFRDVSGKNRTGWASWNNSDAGAVKQILDDNNHAIAFTKSGRLGISNFNIDGPLTISAWVKPNGTRKHFQTIISNGDTSWRLNLFENTFKAHFVISGMTPEFINSKQDISPNQWTLVTGVYSGNMLKMYINGVLDSEIKVTGTVGQYNNNIEVAGNHRQANRNFEGSLDGVQVYSKALSAIEILKLYQEGRP